MKKSIINIFIFVLFFIMMPALYPDQIHLSDGRVINGKIIDKTPTKYIIERSQEDSSITELAEIEISDVTTIIKESTGETELIAKDAVKKDESLDDQKDEDGDPEKKSPFSFDMEKLKDIILDKRDDLNDLIVPYIENLTGDADNAAIDFIKDYCVEIITGLALLIIFLLISRLFLKKKTTKKRHKEYMANRLPDLKFHPLKGKKQFKNLSFPNIHIYYQIPQATVSYQESICKDIVEDGAYIITDEEISVGTTLRLIIVREKKIGRNIIKEDIHLNGDVKDSKEASVNNYFEVYISFHHLFLRQRAFISKIVSQTTP